MQLSFCSLRSIFSHFILFCVINLGLEIKLVRYIFACYNFFFQFLFIAHTFFFFFLTEYELFSLKNQKRGFIFVLDFFQTEAFGKLLLKKFFSLIKKIGAGILNFKCSKFRFFPIFNLLHICDCLYMLNSNLNAFLLIQLTQISKFLQNLFLLINSDQSIPSIVITYKLSLNMK